jgi:hypothetical protein
MFCGEANLNISGGTNNFEWSNSGDFNTILSSTSNLNLKLDALKTKNLCPFQRMQFVET